MTFSVYATFLHDLSLSRFRKFCDLMFKPVDLCWLSYSVNSLSFQMDTSELLNKLMSYVFCFFLVHTFTCILCSCVHISIAYALRQLLYTSSALQNNSKVAANHVSCDFRVRLPRSQIIRLTKGTVEEYDKMCNVQKPSSELQAYVIVISLHSHIVWHGSGVGWGIGLAI